MRLRPPRGDRRGGSPRCGAGCEGFLCFVVISLCLAAAPAGAGTFANWRYRQEMSLPAAGLIRLELSPETLDGARPALEDLRILDPSGGEVPYVIEQGRPTAKATREVKALRVSLVAASTILTIETGQVDPLDGVTLMTPAESFIKAVQVDGSTDGKRWRPLAHGLPLFRQPTGASQLHLPFPAGVWRHLRVTVDDRRSPPVPFTGARAQVAALDPVSRVPVEVRITERTDNPGETRLALHLGAAHLRLATLQIETPEPLFARRVTLAARRVEGDTIREKTLAEGVIFRTAHPGRPPSSQLTIPAEITTPSRELLLLVRNEESPPLQISAIRAERRPAYVVFMARQGGPHALLTGNRLAPAPRYDLASLTLDVRAAAASPQLSALGPNPDYRAAEALPSAATSGPALDVSAWSHRKRVQMTGAGMQEFDLDLDVLSRALPSLADLRLLNSGQQLPYILEQTSLARALVPRVTSANDPRNPRLSRWELRLPHRHLPLTRLTCTSGTLLFRRQVLLSEEATDERGGKHQRGLGRATWVRTPEQHSKELLLTLDRPPTTETLILEANNEDNPPITLENCQFFYPVWRVHFQAAPEAYLYYGNRRAEVPRYDLSLIADQVLRVEQAVGSLAAEEQIKAGWPDRIPLMWRGGLLLWITLAVVVAVLLLVISRLLPKPSPPSGQ